MDRAMKAAQLFENGYNCAQSVAVAFCDVIGMTEKQAARAVSGMVFVTSMLYGYDTPGNDEEKMAHYAMIQDFAGQFKEMGAGSVVCREILKNPPSDPKPSERTEEYYRLRPCARLCYNAGAILQKYIEEHPIAE